jgi:hypothetical protein
MNQKFLAYQKEKRINSMSLGTRAHFPAQGYKQKNELILINNLKLKSYDEPKEIYQTSCSSRSS